MMRKYILFYSWQADNQDVKRFIRKSIDTAINELKQKGIDILLDQDTRDRIGTTSIDDEVLKKIRECDIFLADLTPVSSYESDGIIKLVPNSNVIFEYGYAKGTIGMSKCILVSKLSEDQNVSQLPFDINHDTISVIKSDNSLSNLKYWIQKIADEVERDKDSQRMKYHCSVLFDNFNTLLQVAPVFKRTIYGIETDSADIDKIEVFLKDGWSNRQAPMFMRSTNGALITPSSEIINKSLSRIALQFINDGNEVLENCELTVIPIEEGVRFEDGNYKSAYSTVNYLRGINDPFTLSKRKAQVALKDVNPNSSKEIDVFYLYVPANLSRVNLSWKMTSKHYSQEGVLSINIRVHYRDYSESDGEQKIIVEDYIVIK